MAKSSLVKPEDSCTVILKPTVSAFFGYTQRERERDWKKTIFKTGSVFKSEGESSVDKSETGTT